MRNATIALGSAGIMMMVASIIRWSFVYFDLSQLVQATLIGFMFVSFAFAYEKLQNMQGELIELKKMRSQIKTEIIEYISR